MQLIFLDIEGTGLDLEHDRLCQVCYCAGDTTRTEYFKPRVPMSVKAMSITHITNRMLEDRPPFTGSDMKAELGALLADGVLVAHNAAYDAGMLEAEGLAVPRRICTLKVSRHLDPDGLIPEHKLQYLRYHHDLDVEGGAHDAEGDVNVLAALFPLLRQELMRQEGISEEASIDRMIGISAQPSLRKRFTFGKHNGELIGDVAMTDPGYLRWLLEQKRNSPQQEEEWIYTLEHYLGAGGAA